jgi:hypothetical protein
MWPFGRTRNRRAEGQAVAPAREEDELWLLDLLTATAQARLDGQLRDSHALDTIALGVLAVDAAAIALMIAVRSALGPFWSAPTAGLGLAGVFLLAPIWPRTFDTGPDARRFYETMSGSPRVDASGQMLSELLAAIDRNDRQIPGKNRLFKIGFGALLIALVGSLVVALVG